MTKSRRPGKRWVETILESDGTVQTVRVDFEDDQECLLFQQYITRICVAAHVAAMRGKPPEAPLIGCVRAWLYPSGRYKATYPRGIAVLKLAGIRVPKGSSVGPVHRFDTAQAKRIRASTPIPTPRPQRQRANA